MEDWNEAWDWGNGNENGAGPMQPGPPPVSSHAPPAANAPSNAQPRNMFRKKGNDGPRAPMYPAYVAPPANHAAQLNHQAPTPQHHQNSAYPANSRENQFVEQVQPNWNDVGRQANFSSHEPPTPGGDSWNWGEEDNWNHVAPQPEVLQHQANAQPVNQNPPPHQIPLTSYQAMSIPSEFVNYSGFTPASNEGPSYAPYQQFYSEASNNDTGVVSFGATEPVQAAGMAHPSAVEEKSDEPLQRVEMNHAAPVGFDQAPLDVADSNHAMRDGATDDTSSTAAGVSSGALDMPESSASTWANERRPVDFEESNDNEDLTEEVTSRAEFAADHRPESDQAVDLVRPAEVEASVVPPSDRFFEREGDGYQPADAHLRPAFNQAAANAPPPTRYPPSPGSSSTSSSSSSSSSSSASLGVRQETIGEAAGDGDDAGDDGDDDGCSADENGDGDGSPSGAPVPIAAPLPPPAGRYVKGGRGVVDDERIGGPGPERSTPPPRKETIGSESDGLETMGMGAVGGPPSRPTGNRPSPGGASDPRRQIPAGDGRMAYPRRPQGPGAAGGLPAASGGGTSSETDDRRRRGRETLPVKKRGEEMPGRETPGGTTSPTGGENSADESGRANVGRRGNERDKRKKDDRVDKDRDRYAQSTAGKSRRQQDDYVEEDKRRRHGGRRHKDSATVSNEVDASSDELDYDERGSYRSNRHNDRRDRRPSPRDRGERSERDRNRRPTASVASTAGRDDRDRYYRDRDRRYDPDMSRESAGPGREQGMVVAKRAPGAVATPRYGPDDVFESRDRARRDRSSRWHGYDDDDDDARSRRSRGYSSVYDRDDIDSQRLYDSDWPDVEYRYSRSRPASRSGYPRYDDPYYRQQRQPQVPQDYARYPGASFAGGYPYGGQGGMDPYYMNYAAQYMAQFVAAAATKQLVNKLNITGTGASVNEREKEEAGVDVSVVRAGEAAVGEDGSAKKQRPKDVPKYSGDHAIGDFLLDGRYLIKYPGHESLDIFGMGDIAEGVETFETYDAALVQFPGPLSRSSSKKTILVYCEKLIEELDPAVASDHILLIEFIVLLIKQNGSMMNSDIAELLVKRCDMEAAAGIYSAVGREVGEGGVMEQRATAEGQETGMTPRGDGASSAGISVVDAQLELEEAGGDEAVALETFYRFMLAGQRSEALDHAVGAGLWGHAALLASKMMPGETGAYERMLAAFSESLRPQDPLKTLYQLVLHQTSPNITNWDPSLGDWRTHVAMMIGNCDDDEMVSQAIERMGDNLRALGRLHAAQFCYLVAGSSFGAWEDTGARLVLLGAGRGDSSSVVNYEDVTTNYAIGLTELYEYGMRLAHPEFSIPQLQVFKLIKVERLLDTMKSEIAYDYVAAIGEWIGRTGASGVADSAAFIEAVAEVAESLKPIGFRRARNRDAPAWLVALKAKARAVGDGTENDQQIQELRRPSVEQKVNQIQPPPARVETQQQAAEVSQRIVQPPQQQFQEQQLPPQQPQQEMRAPDFVQQPSETMPPPNVAPMDAYNQPWRQGPPTVAPPPSPPPTLESSTSVPPSEPMMPPSMPGQMQQKAPMPPAGLPPMGSMQGFQPGHGEVDQGGMSATDSPSRGPKGRSGSFNYWDSAVGAKNVRKESVSSVISNESDRQSVSSASTLTSAGPGNAGPPGHPGIIGSNRRKYPSGSENYNQQRYGMQPPQPAPDMSRSGQDSQPVWGPPSAGSYQPLPTVPMPPLPESRPAPSGPPPHSQQQPNQAKLDDSKQEKKGAMKNGGIAAGAGGGGIGSVFKKFAESILPKAPNQMILPDDSKKSIVWDDSTKKWVNLDQSEADAATAGPVAPPRDFELPGGPPPGPMSSPMPPSQPLEQSRRDQLAPPGHESTMASPTNMIQQGSRPQSESTPKAERNENARGPPGPPPSSNRFKRQGGRLGYVDVLNPNRSAAEGKAPLKPAPVFPTNVFIPAPPDPTAEPLDFVSRPGETSVADEPPAEGNEMASGNFVNPDNFRVVGKQPPVGTSRPMAGRYPQAKY